MMSTIEVWQADGLSVDGDWRFEAQTRSVRPYSLDRQCEASRAN